jgi:hypothetical protein
MKVEVFKTNVLHADEAKVLVGRIHASFRHYRANFDLGDCDRILRVTSAEFINVPAVIAFLKQCGFEAEVLPDDIPELLRF